MCPWHDIGQKVDVTLGWVVSSVLPGLGGVSPIILQAVQMVATQNTVLRLVALSSLGQLSETESQAPSQTF